VPKIKKIDNSGGPNKLFDNLYTSMRFYNEGFDIYILIFTPYYISHGTEGDNQTCFLESKVSEASRSFEFFSPGQTRRSLAR